MIRILSGTALAIALASASVFAQTPPPKAPSPDASVEAKFKAADKNSNGTLDGAEVDAFKAHMTTIDADKDGKISQPEFTAAVKAGHIK